MYRSGRVSLLAVADATPEDHEIRFLDEHAEPIDYDATTDVVGVSFSTSLAPRAYEIGDEFRRRGVPVIFGGYHATFLPDEALAHCDSVCIGEAEPVWPRMLHDLENWKLGRSYHSVARTDLIKSRPLRKNQWDSDSHETLNVVMAGRGCPNACDYCSVTEFFGNTYRHRPVEEIVKEVEALGSK
ncbi:MAG TPA: cobalamin-dependent protein, partial [Bacteroidota bacterium]|nr:cobalamin-dependent protein [Bacteroidota bacterium]